MRDSTWWDPPAAHVVSEKYCNALAIRHEQTSSERVSSIPSKPIWLAAGPEPTTKPLDAAHNLGVKISLFHKVVQALELHASQIQMYLRISGILLDIFYTIFASLGTQGGTDDTLLSRWLAGGLFE